MTNGYPPIEIGVPIGRRSVPIAGASLGSGGQGTVHPTSLRVSDVPLVYKEYKPETLAALSSGGLQKMTRLIRDMTDGERDAFLAAFAWPIAVVADHQRAVGFLMPQVPDRFHVALQSRRGPREPVLAQFQLLLNAPSFLSNRGIALSHRDQFALLGAVANAVQLLHRRGIVVGDLSPLNLLFSASARPHAAYFIDCDAMVVKGESVSPQAETPGWGVPDGEQRGTVESDSYKFGLLALRLLAGDQDTRDPGRLPTFADSVRPLVERALSADASQRPKPSDWIPSLMLAERRASDVLVDGDTDLTDVSTARSRPMPDVKQPPQTGPTVIVPPGSTPPQPASPMPNASSAASAGVGRIDTPVPDKKSKAGWYFAAIVAAVVSVLVLGANGVFADDKKSSNNASVTGPEVTTPPTSRSTSPPVIETSPEPVAEYMVPGGVPVNAAETCNASTSERYRPTSRPNVEREYLHIAVADTVPATHCNFAIKVAAALDAADDSGEILSVVSPNTNRVYDMECGTESADPFVVKCSDGNTAEVLLYY